MFIFFLSLKKPAIYSNWGICLYYVIIPAELPEDAGYPAQQKYNKSNNWLGIEKAESFTQQKVNMFELNMYILYYRNIAFY